MLQNLSLEERLKFIDNQIDQFLHASDVMEEVEEETLSDSNSDPSSQATPREDAAFEASSLGSPEL